MLLFLLAWHVLALLALAVLPAFQTSLEAFAVFLQTVGLLAVAALEMLVGFYLLPEGVGITIHQH